MRKNLKYKFKKLKVFWELEVIFSVLILVNLVKKCYNLSIIEGSLGKVVGFFLSYPSSVSGKYPSYSKRVNLTLKLIKYKLKLNIFKL